MSHVETGIARRGTIARGRGIGHPLRGAHHSDQVPFGGGELAEFDLGPGHRRRAEQASRAQALGLGERCLDIGNSHVERDVAGIVRGRARVVLLPYLTGRAMEEIRGYGIGARIGGSTESGRTDMAQPAAPLAEVTPGRQHEACSFATKAQGRIADFGDSTVAERTSWARLRHRALALVRANQLLGQQVKQKAVLPAPKRSRKYCRATPTGRKPALRKQAIAVSFSTSGSATRR
jgi:hypothetical protein